jgi:hypothetical protein
MWPEFSKAADPTNIIWENLKYRCCSRFVRSLFIALVSIVLMIGSFIAIILAKNYSET